MCEEIPCKTLYLIAEHDLQFPLGGLPFPSREAKLHEWTYPTPPLSKVQRVTHQGEWGHSSGRVTLPRMASGASLEKWLSFLCEAAHLPKGSCLDLRLPFPPLPRWSKQFPFFNSPRHYFLKTPWINTTYNPVGGIHLLRHLSLANAQLVRLKRFFCQKPILYQEKSLSLKHIR